MIERQAIVVESPFKSRFAITSIVEESKRTRIHISPIHDLKQFSFPSDMDRYEEIGKRQREELGIERNPYLVERPHFNVNGKWYSGDFEVSIVFGNILITHYAGLGDELTPAAEAKIRDWVRSEIFPQLTPAARLRFKLANAQGELDRKLEKVSEAQEKLNAANEDYFKALGEWEGLFSNTESPELAVGELPGSGKN